MDLAEIPDGIDRIGLSGPHQLDIGNGKERICQRGPLQHLQTMRRFNDLFHIFMGRDRRRDEDYLRQTEGFSNFLCPPEMAQVDWIKGPPKETDPFFFCFPFNLLAPLLKTNST
jgi:hypothetical protein